MNIYICNAPIRFPRSEYGGLIVVMAPNKRRLGKILEAHYIHEKKDGFFDLSISVKSCKELKLDPLQEYAEGIVSEFLT